MKELINSKRKANAPAVAPVPIASRSSAMNESSPDSPAGRALQTIRDYKSFDSIARAFSDSDLGVRSAALDACLNFTLKKPELATQPTGLPPPPQRSWTRIPSWTSGT